jgi:hypothetical protein
MDGWLTAPVLCRIRWASTADPSAPRLSQCWSAYRPIGPLCPPSLAHRP